MENINANNFQYNEDGGGGGDNVETPNKLPQNGKDQSSNKNSNTKIPTPIVFDYQKKRTQYRARKSKSMFDMQRTKIKQQKSNGHSYLNLNENDEELIMTNYVEQNEDNNSGNKVMIAKLKIIIAMVLNTWRKRKDDIKKFKDEIEQTKVANLKYKNQIHLLNSVYRNERKLHDTLKEEIKELKKNIKDISFDLVNSKTENALLHGQIEKKTNEMEELNKSLIILQNDLENEKNVTAEFESKHNSSIAQEVEITIENDYLKNKIDNLKNKYNEKCSEHDVIVNNYTNKFNTVSETYKTLIKTQEAEIKEYKKMDLAQRDYIHELSNELLNLKNEMSITFFSKLKRVLSKVPRNSLHYLRTFAQILLPFRPKTLYLKNDTNLKKPEKLNLVEKVSKFQNIL